MTKKYLKLMFLFALPLFLYACGGGGGGSGGAAGGGVGTGTVTNCSDTGTDFQTYEYYNTGSDLGSSGAGNDSPLQYVCASSAYARDATGNGIQVAVIDTGIRATHGDLDGNMVSFTEGSDVVNSDDDASDDQGHGTHVAGIIAGERQGGVASSHGVAYDADIYGFKAFNSSGVAPSGATGTAYGLVEAIGAIDIINNSWGSNADCTSASNCRTIIGTTLYDNWEDTAQLSTPKISVFAAGNDSESEPSAQCQTMIYNSDINAVSVCVVAISTDDSGGYSQGKGLLATFSNKCGSVSAYCIAAPGDTLYNTGYSSNTHYTTKSGTSMAAPMVSGGLALVMQEFSSLTPAQVVSRLLTTANDSGEYSQTSIYGHGLMNLNAATTAIAELQTINGSNLLDDPNTSYNDLVNNSFLSSAAFSNALNSALNGQVMEVYDSFDRANFKVKVSDFFSSGSNVSQNTIQNHLARLQPKQKNENSYKNLYGNFNVVYEGEYLKSSLFQTSENFIILGYNQSSNDFENSVDPLSSFFNDSEFGNKYLVNPYFYTGSGEDYFMSFNPNNSFGVDTFTNQNSSDYGLSLNFSPSPSGNDQNLVEDLQIVLGTSYEENKFLNSSSSGAFSVGDMSHTNFTGLKYKKNISDDLTFIGSGYTGYTHIDKAANSYIDRSSPILTSSFTLGLAKSNFLKEKQNIGFFINQPQRVENGNINLRLPTSSDRDRTVTYSNLNVDLEPDSRQLNLDIIFNKEITETSNLRANITHVKNGDHSSASESQNFISLYYKKTF